MKEDFSFFSNLIERKISNGRSPIEQEFFVTLYLLNRQIRYLSRIHEETGRRSEAVRYHVLDSSLVHISTRTVRGFCCQRRRSGTEKGLLHRRSIMDTG